MPAPTTTRILGALAAAALLDARNRPPPATRSPAPPRWRFLDGSYAASLTAAIIALSPFIVVTTAYAMFTEQVQQELGTSQTALSVISGLSTAGYAWGALLGGDLVQRFRQRRLFFVCQCLFALGCALAALAHGPALYAAGRVLSGVATGLLLVIALPPVIQRFPAAKLPVTVVFVNIGFFGAVCIGPLLGGWVAAGDAWRWFFAALGAIGIANLLLAAVTLPDRAPSTPTCPSISPPLCWASALWCCRSGPAENSAATASPRSTSSLHYLLERSASWRCCSSSITSRNRSPR